MRLAGSKPAKVEGVDLLNSRSNYFLGDDPSAWRTDIPQFREVRARSVYPGVDVIYRGSGRELEYDFVLEKGVSPGVIRLEFSGTDNIRIDRGALVIASKSGALRQHLPAVFQDTPAGRRTLRGEFRKLGDRSVGFHVDGYDPQLALVIDPVATFVTYVGGSGTENGYAMTLDSAGNIYVAGSTNSQNFPLVPAPAARPVTGAKDVFVAKYTSGGTLVYSTIIGGSGDDLAYGIAVDIAGNVYLTGPTSSFNFPTASPIQSSNRGGPSGFDAFIVKLNPAGSALVYSTYYGGSNDDVANGIAVDSVGNAYICGTTYSTDFPTVNPIQSMNNSLFGLSNGFFTKIDAKGATVLASTYLGGSIGDFANAITVDANGFAYIGGGTGSPDFPITAGTFQQKLKNSIDGFVARINPDGSSLGFSTFLGGTGTDYVNGIAIDSQGNAYVTGRTESSDFPVTAGAPQSTLSGPSDIFITKVNKSGVTLAYSTYFGGPAKEEGFGIAVDGSGSAYVVGVTQSTSLPTVNPVQTAFGGGSSDALLCKLDPSGTKIQFASFFGGSAADLALSPAVDRGGNFYAFGTTGSTTLGTAGAAQPTFGGGDYDAFLLKINLVADPTILNVSPASFAFTGTSAASIAHQTLTVASPGGGTTAWTVAAATSSGGNWLVLTPLSGRGAGTVDVSISPSITLVPGSYNGTITFSNSGTGTTTAVPVTLTLTQAMPAISQGGVVNGASFQPGAVSPGMIATIYGSGIGPAMITGAQLDAAGNLASQVAGTRVTFDGVPAPIIYTSATQLGVIVPYNIPGPTTKLLVQYNSLLSNVVTLNLTPSVPAIFTADSSGKGQAAALNQDGTYNSAATPAAAGSVVVLYATGEGQTDPLGTDGKIANGVYPKPILPVGVTIGGVQAQVLYAGAAPGLVAGVMQINVQVPQSLTRGNQPVLLTVGQSTGPAVTVAVKAAQ